MHWITFFSLAFLCLFLVTQMSYLMGLFHSDCAGGDIVWKFRKRKNECNSIFLSVRKCIGFKTPSKVSVKNRLLFWPLWFTYFTDSVIVYGEKSFGKRSFRKAFCCLGVGQVTWIGCGKFQCCRTDQEAPWELSWAVLTSLQKRTQNLYSKWNG